MIIKQTTLIAGSFAFIEVKYSRVVENFIDSIRLSLFDGFVFSGPENRSSDSNVVRLVLYRDFVIRGHAH